MDELDISQARKLITAITLNREKFGDTNQLDDLVDIAVGAAPPRKSLTGHIFKRVAMDRCPRS